MLAQDYVNDAALNDGYNIINRNPFASLYGVSSQQPGQIPAAGELSGAFQLEFANNFASSTAAGDTVVLDGESIYATLDMRRGFGNGWSGGLEIPLVNHSGGFLDGIIESWHDLFGIDDDRDATQKDQLDYRYSRGATTLADVDDSVTGFGDVRLNIGKSLIEGDETAASAWFQVKLPTGDAEDLTGSGAFDVSARLQGSQRLGTYTTLYGGAGIAWLGEGDVLADQQEDFAGSFTAGLSWQRWSRVALKVQLDGQTSLYSDAPDQVGSDAAQLSFGGSFYIGKRTIFDLAVVEDEINGDASPDFGIHMRVRRISQ
ncbi:MAG: hypothetical protein DHS20C01_28990 [marine bacterium B5-7]|nr:MAG: hypothetical protein DHS20C01_28990 [marine bacterium B5-7]